MAWRFIILSCIISVVFAQEEAKPFDFDKSSLPKELQNFNESEIENVKNKYMEQFKQKCEKNGHGEVYENIQNAVQDFMACSNSLVDMNALQEEIEEAKPTGKVDEVFKKYCGKTPEFKKCFRNMTETVKPCFAPEEQKNFKTLYNVTDQLTEFICYKDGDRIALFIAEGGKECFQDKQEEVQNCFNQTVDTQTQSSLQSISFENFLELEFKEKQCNQLTQLQKCVVSALEGCEKPTSANIVEALFNFVRKATPCKNFAKAEKSTKQNAANGFAITSGTIIMALVTVLLV